MNGLGWRILDVLFGACLGTLLGSAVTAWFSLYIQGERIADADDVQYPGESSGSSEQDR